MSYIKTEERIIETETVTTTFKALEDWKGNCFESSSYKTKEFLAFARMFRSYVVKEAAKNGLGLENWSNGHFYCSAFFKNSGTGKYVYLSISDVRHFSDSWYDDILVRTAEHPKDYTGGRNQSASLKNIGMMLKKLTE